MIFIDTIIFIQVFILDIILILGNHFIFGSILFIFLFLFITTKIFDKWVL